ncbi:MAG: transcriptional regulator GcvA [Rhodovibrionaceae bacterium]
MTRRLPPLNALRAFEAAARHLSFTKAAEELHVTPAAVSQQVKALEDYCGVQLFRRLTRALMLTDAGQAVLPALKESFDLLGDVTERLMADQKAGILTVSVAPSFGSKWLVPRLERFRQAHPDFDVRIDANDALANFAVDGVDIAIRYGRGVYDNLRADCLITEISYPVCSPKLLESGPPLKHPRDLAGHTLIHVQWKMEQEHAPNWRMWLRAAGVEGVDAERGTRFSADSMAVQAAIEGHGIALAGSALVGDDLREGRLIRPFPPSVCEATTFCYYVVYPETKAENPKVAAFRDWLMEEAARAEDGGEAALSA